MDGKDKLIVSEAVRLDVSKAVAVWSALDGEGHAGLVELYLRRAGLARVETRRVRAGRPGDPLTAVLGWR